MKKKKSAGVDLTGIDFEAITRTILADAVAVFKASQASGSASVATGTRRSAVAEVTQRVAELLAKSETSPGAAMDQVFNDDRQAGGNLYARWKKESQF